MSEQLDPIMGEDEASHDCSELNLCVLCNSPGYLNEERMEYICVKCERRLARHADELYALQMDAWVDSQREVFETRISSDIHGYWLGKSEHGR